jgi:uncharacterized membrane protein YfcA
MAGAIVILIAVSGATTLAISGTYYGNVTTPLSIGYINLSGFFVFVPVTMVMAQLGAKAVYKIDKKLLSKILVHF